MLKKIFVIALLAAVFVSCKSKQAFNFSEAIVAKERSLAEPIKKEEKSAGEFISAGKFDSLSALGERMEKLVQQKIDEIEDMKAPGGKEAEDFKAASIRYFKYMKSVYTGYKTVGNASSDEEREKRFNDLQELVQDKTEVIADMQATQKKFAEANGFKVQ
jgi:uncharacterized protein YcfL